MASYKHERLTQDIKRVLSMLVRDLKDPRIQNKMISFIRVELSGDLSYAKVYVSAMEGMEVAQEAVKGLKSASGFLKRELSNALHLRRCPELNFIADDSIEYSAHLNEIFSEMHQEEESKER